MSDEKDSYKQIFKATSIFGGLQVFNIIISIIRSKIIAVLLGPAGLGLISIFNTTSSLIGSFTNLGITTSSVKSIAAANNDNDPLEIGKVVAIFKKLIWLTGGLGLFVLVILSPLLSEVSFNNTNYIFSFMLIGVSLLLLQLASGQNAILQGLRKVKLLALSSLFGALIGLIISIPLYIFFKENGIVPAILATGFAGVLSSWYFLKKVKIPRVSVSLSTVKKEGREMVRLGFFISLTSLLTVGSSYILRLFILNKGSIVDVGLYTAGFAIIGTYVGMVFSAMSADYYPSLSAVANDQTKFNEKINQQILMSTLILAPILTLLIVFIKLGIVILYSESFLSIVKLIQWAALGIFFQGFSWCIGFLFLAKGDTKVYFWNEFIPNVYVLGFNCFGYLFWGIEGLGISFLASYFLYFLQVSTIAIKRYGFKLNIDIFKICILQCFVTLAAFIVTYSSNSKYAYPVGILLIVTSSFISFYVLKRKMGFANLLKTK